MKANEIREKIQQKLKSNLTVSVRRSLWKALSFNDVILEDMYLAHSDNTNFRYQAHRKFTEKYHVIFTAELFSSFFIHGLGLDPTDRSVTGRLSAKKYTLRGI